MKRVLFILIALLAAVPAAAQKGDKSTAKRIEFLQGQASTTLSGNLGYDQEAQYVFTARAGQKVTITNPSTSLFDVRIFSEENDLETEYDSSRIFSVTLPSDGDYLLFVRKKRVKSGRRTRFAITLRIM